MADPKNLGYMLTLKPTADPDVIHVFEFDDVDGRTPMRAVSAVEAGRLAARADAVAASSNKPADGAATPKKPAKKAVKRG